MNKYKVIKQIHSCFASYATMDVYLKYEFELPIEPFVGLIVYGHDLEFTITKIVYSEEDNKLILHTDEDKELYDAELNKREPDRSIDEIVQEYLDVGWKQENED